MDYEALRRIRNEQNSFGNLVGVRIEEIREGYARSVLDVRADLSNPIGSLHGGVLFTIADITGGSAAVSHGEQVTTVDADIRYLRPGIGVKRIVCEAEEIKKGKTLFVYRIDVRDQDGTLLTAGTFTYMSLRKKIEF
ncbi:MAG TPA: PaaI family thioesterase [Candidatus Mediterraneibacter stercoravium]|uniref:PaaI family thioesterase n=1 Tax=Candidatus Mediterraneibacter stercoravium TaxID=2838685 RepID=A0A9D2K1Y6_9FIRM|nr:PaaI family thioesterase [Candidatus Mediterraneibacter stercoravium]